MVIHILSDGKIVKDITGHVVKVSDAQTVYTLIETINQKNMRKRGGNNDKRMGQTVNNYQ